MGEGGLSYRKPDREQFTRDLTREILDQISRFAGISTLKGTLHQNNAKKVQYRLLPNTNST